MRLHDFQVSVQKTLHHFSSQSVVIGSLTTHYSRTRERILADKHLTVSHVNNSDTWTIIHQEFFSTKQDPMTWHVISRSYIRTRVLFIALTTHGAPSVAPSIMQVGDFEIGLDAHLKTSSITPVRILCHRTFKVEFGDRLR